MAEGFQKYVHRNILMLNMKCTTNPEDMIHNTLNKLKQQEDIVMYKWTMRKKSLDDCQQFVLFESSAKQALDWFGEISEKYLTSNLKDSDKDPSRLLNEHNEFKSNCKVGSFTNFFSIKRFLSFFFYESFF